MCYWCKNDACKNCHGPDIDCMFEKNDKGTVVVVLDDEELILEASEWINERMPGHLEQDDDDDTDLAFDRGEVCGRCYVYAELLSGKALVKKLTEIFEERRIPFDLALGVWRFPDGHVEGLKALNKKKAVANPDNITDFEQEAKDINANRHAKMMEEFHQMQDLMDRLSQ